MPSCAGFDSAAQRAWTSASWRGSGGATGAGLATRATRSDSELRVGSEEFDGGRYLRWRRMQLQNRRADGSLSSPYPCEFADRPRHGTDAVAVALWRRAAGGGVEVLLNSRRTQGFSTEMFTAFGVDLSSRRIVVTKSSQHFHAAYAPLSSRVIYADAPGSVSTDLAALPWRKVRRPRWPI